MPREKDLDPPASWPHKLAPCRPCTRRRRCARILMMRLAIAISPPIEVGMLTSRPVSVPPMANDEYAGFHRLRAGERAVVGMVIQEIHSSQKSTGVRLQAATRCSSRSSPPIRPVEASLPHQAYAHLARDQYGRPPESQHHAFFERYGLIAASATSALRDPNEACSLPARRTRFERHSDSARARSSAVCHHAHMDEWALRRNASPRLRRSSPRKETVEIAEAQFSTATSSHMIETPPTGIDTR